MNLQLCLCHFCEIHGPSVLFNTFPLDLGHAIEFESARLTLGRQESSLNESEHMRSRLVNANLKHVNPDLWSDYQSESEETYLFDDDFTQETVSCEGCSLHTNTNQADLITFDLHQNVLYLTEGFHDKPALFPRSYPLNTIRLICLRALSCELYPHNGGMLYFGTEEGVHVLSFLFSLQDSKARGFQRKYSVILMSKDNKDLFNNWDIIINSITFIISLLQRKAKGVFKAELTPEACLNKRSMILDKMANAGKNMNYFEEIFDASNTSKKKINARSLIEITGDNSIFFTLHMQFISILDGLLQRIENSVQFLSDIFNFDDNVIDMLEDNASLRELYALMGSEHFCLIASNVVLGNRVIVYDSNFRQRTKLFMAIVAKLLPKQCIQTMSDLSWVKGQPNLVNFCAHVKGEDTRRLTVDLCLCVQISDKPEQANGPSSGLGEGQQGPIDLLRRSCLHVHSCDESAHVPSLTYITQVERLLRDVSLSDETVNACLNTLKLEWWNKSQLMQAFATEAANLSSDNIDKILAQLGISNHDLRLVQFWSKL